MLILGDTNTYDECPKMEIDPSMPKGGSSHPKGEDHDITSRFASHELHAQHSHTRHSLNTMLVSSISKSNSYLLMQVTCLIISASTWRLAKGQGNAEDTISEITTTKERTRSTEDRNVNNEGRRRKGKGLIDESTTARDQRAKGTPLLTIMILSHRKNNPKASQAARSVTRTTRDMIVMDKCLLIRSQLALSLVLALD